MPATFKTVSIMVEPTWIKLVATLVFVASLLLFIWLQFKIAEPIELESHEQLPDESEVFGKELPVGFRFRKDGDVVEVTALKVCNGCVYDCFIKEQHPWCSISFRPTYNDSVIFKKVDDE